MKQFVVQRDSVRQENKYIYEVDGIEMSSLAECEVYIRNKFKEGTVQVYQVKQNGKPYANYYNRSGMLYKRNLSDYYFKLW